MRKKADIHAFLVIAVFYLVIELAGVTCPIRFLTGLSCAGCGMSRAWLSVLHGDWAAAYAYHPLFLLPVPTAAILLLRRHLPKQLARGVLVCVCALFLAVYLIRLFDPTDRIVCWDPDYGLIGWVRRWLAAF